jgi:hypothetical protein
MPPPALQVTPDPDRVNHRTLSKMGRRGDGPPFRGAGRRSSTSSRAVLQWLDDTATTGPAPTERPGSGNGK